MIDNIKSSVEFLSPDTNINNDYKLVRTRKSVFNVPKKQLNEASNVKVVDYFIQPKNQFNEAFGSYRFIDFELPRNELCYYQFVLKFDLKANNVQTNN